MTFDNILHGLTIAFTGMASVVGWFLREAFKDFKIALAAMILKQSDLEVRVARLEERMPTRRRR
jgi:hypothetical protein